MFPGGVIVCTVCYFNFYHYFFAPRQTELVFVLDVMFQLKIERLLRSLTAGSVI